MTIVSTQIMFPPCGLKVKKMTPAMRQKIKRYERAQNHKILEAGTQVSALEKEVQLLKDRPMSVNFIKGDDKRTKFYTGLTTFFFSRPFLTL